MGFQSGLSGLNVAAKNLDVIGNNVANAGTVGFKGSRAIFADVFASSLNGSGGGQVGIGAKVSKVQQQFTQGNVSVTNNPLDVAINGGGFFRLSNNGTISYSRNGQFNLDSSGYIVNSDGLQVTGYPVDSAGNVVPSSPQPLQLSTADVSPNATTEFDASINLDSRAASITLPFSATDPATYTNSTSGTVYDSLGNPHVMTLYFSKTATAGQWSLHATLNGGPVTDVNLGAGAGTPVNLNFDNLGRMSTAMPLNTSITLANGAVTPLAFELDFGRTSQFGTDFTVSSLAQNGYAAGRMSGFSISAEGVIVGRYSNGQALQLGQIVLANFANPGGLRALGNNQWEETADSGLALVGEPLTGSLGSLQSAAVEDSNVDLTQELVNMITAQRAYQANAQTIKTIDQVLQTLVNLR
ncbi:MAG: flagellar hook protein FlgE [Burkholderiales bacterium]|nr:flagellar hook protein FlgE [Burkholderiales bacterium]